jgi:hypothetical protein
VRLRPPGPAYQRGCRGRSPYRLVPRLPARAGEPSPGGQSVRLLAHRCAASDYAAAARLSLRIAEETGKQPVPPPAWQWSEPEWQQVAPGIECKLLATDTERHRVSMLVRLAPQLRCAWSGRRSRLERDRLHLFSRHKHQRYSSLKRLGRVMRPYGDCPCAPSSACTPTQEALWHRDREHRRPAEGGSFAPPSPRTNPKARV